MKTSLLKHLALFAFVAFLGILINSCGEDTILTPPINPPDTACTDTTLTGLMIKGRVTFVDTNFIRTGGVYLISAYPKTSWPPTSGPAAYDTIRVSGNDLNYCYTLSNLPDSGSYVVSVGWRKATGGQSPIMSIYGCDTLHSLTCLFTPSKFAYVPLGGGVRNINMISWSDTTKKIY